MEDITIKEVFSKKQKEWNAGDVFRNSDAMAGQTIVRPTGRRMYIWKECKIIKKSGKIQGTDINTYEVIDDKGRTFTLDDNDLQELEKLDLKI